MATSFLFISGEKEITLLNFVFYIYPDLKLWMQFYYLNLLELLDVDEQLLVVFFTGCCLLVAHIHLSWHSYVYL